MRNDCAVYIFKIVAFVNNAGRVYRVQLQAEASYRMKPDDLTRVHVRSATSNAMIPLSAVSSIKRIVGPEQVERFNGFVAAKIIPTFKRI